MRREVAVVDGPAYDSVCFHIQQCVEKTMKAALIAAQADFPKIHDLAERAGLVTAVYPGWTWDAAELDDLTSAAVESRYPGDDATGAEAREAAARCEAIRASLLALLSNGASAEA